MKVAIVGVGSFPVSEVKAMLSAMGHEDIVIVEPEKVKEVSLSDLKIPDDIQPSLIKSLDLSQYEAREGKYHDDVNDSYEKHQKKMRRNHYKHMKHRL